MIKPYMIFASNLTNFPPHSLPRVFVVSCIFRVFHTVGRQCRVYRCSDSALQDHIFILLPGIWPELAHLGLATCCVGESWHNLLEAGETWLQWGCPLQMLLGMIAELQVFVGISVDTEYCIWNMLELSLFYIVFRVSGQSLCFFHAGCDSMSLLWTPSFGCAQLSPVVSEDSYVACLLQTCYLLQLFT